MTALIYQHKITTFYGHRRTCPRFLTPHLDESQTGQLIPTRNMTDFDVFKDEQAALDQARELLVSNPLPGELLVEFENLLRSYSKLFDTSRRLVRMSDRNEEYLKQANIQIRRQQDQLDRELAFAKNVQMSMLPGNGHLVRKQSEYELFAYLKPARSVGGDLYDVQESRGHLHFLVGDVSDKGVPAALFMARTATLYTDALAEDLTPGETLTKMNVALCEGNDECMFVTALCGCLDLPSGTLKLANAGHMHPIHITSEHAQATPVPGKIALGLVEGTSYPDITRELSAGDMLMLYTDGISEAMDVSGGLYDESRLLDCTHRAHTGSAEAQASTLLDDVAQFAKGAEQADDITLMVIRWARQSAP